MKILLGCVVICGLMLAFTGCTVPYPVSGQVVVRNPEGSSVVLHTEQRSYFFYTYVVHDSVMTGMSQIFQQRVPGEPMALDNRFPPRYRNISLRDIIGIEISETKYEPIADIILYGAIPCAAILGVLVPIITHGTP